MSYTEYQKTLFDTLKTSPLDENGRIIVPTEFFGNQFWYAFVDEMQINGYLTAESPVQDLTLRSRCTRTDSNEVIVGLRVSAKFLIETGF